MSDLAIWDKVFPQNDRVLHQKVRFQNRFGLTLVADRYAPKDAVGPLPALAVCGPFGSVKEQCAGDYAQRLAMHGFVTLSFDPSFVGESEGHGRDVASPDLNTEDFCAAVDALSVDPDVNPEQIGLVGICGWGGLALNAATLDTRVKATVAITMYDMTRVLTKGYFDQADSAHARYEVKRRLSAQRTLDVKSGTAAREGGVVDPLPADAPDFVKDYHAYYKTARGYHPRSLNSNQGWQCTSALSFMHSPILHYLAELTTPVLLVHGQKAHSRYFSETVAQVLQHANPTVIWVKDASHVDLYDNWDKIPLTQIVDFLKQTLTR